MADVHPDVSFEGPVWLTTNQRAQRLWWPWFRLNKEWGVRGQSEIPAQRSLLLLYQASTPPTKTTFFLREIRWADRAKLWCNTWKRRKTKSFPLSAEAEFLLPPLPQVEGRFVPKCRGCRWTYTSNCSCFRSNYSSIWLGFSSNPSFPLKQTPEHQSCNPSGDIY